MSACNDTFVVKLNASAQDKHTSTLIMANLQTTGDMCFGAFMAGVVVQLAHLPGHAYTSFLCLFTALGFIPFAISRVRYGLNNATPVQWSSKGLYTRERELESTSLLLLLYWQSSYFALSEHTQGIDFA